MKNVLYALLALAMASCGGAGSKPKDLLTENDFESLDGWSNGGANASLNKEKAHSGVYSVKVAPGLDYGMGFGNQLGKVSSTKVQKIKVHAWAFVPNDKAVAVLVVETKNPGEEKSALWDGTNMSETGKTKGFNKWIELEKTYDLPASTNFNSQLMVYLWRGSSTQPVYLDDVQISRVD